MKIILMEVKVQIMMGAISLKFNFHNFDGRAIKRV